jgi:molecular chaperone GrpE
MTESKTKAQRNTKSGRKKNRGGARKAREAAAKDETAEPGGKPAEPDLNDGAQDELNDRLLRLQADFDNFRKRTQREREHLRRTANSDLVEELLPVLDHFEMGLANARRHEANASVLDGFELVYDQLMGALKQSGLEPVVAAGEVFDPHVHEAITHLPSEEHPADTVITETRRGYRLGDQLLRASQVVVSSGPQDEGDPADEAAPEQTGEEA